MLASDIEGSLFMLNLLFYMGWFTCPKKWGNPEKRGKNGFWGFGHNPANYSKKVQIPTLLIYGELDGRVKRAEIDDIYANLAGKKELLLFPTAGHGNYLEVDEAKWIENVRSFLK